MNGRAGEGFKQCFMQLDNIYTSKTASQRAEAGLAGGVTDAPLATFMERKNPENTTMVQPGCLLLQGTPEAGLGQYPSL